MKLLQILVYWLTLLPLVSAQQLESCFQKYAEKYQPEIAYLHYDKAVYIPGETIWYKAYLLSNGNLSENSKNLYVDFYDNNGNLLKHSIAPIYLSSAKGQFEIPEDFLGQQITIRVYTKWMLNFDSSFIYEKIIPIYTSNITSYNKPVRTEINFFPEGGDLYNNLTNIIAFKANDDLGNPINVKGVIINQSNNIIDSFASSHDGMGLISLRAKEDETYFADWTDESGIHRKDKLPIAKSSGATIEVLNLADKIMIVTKRTPVIPENFSSMHLVAHINDQIIYQSRINFLNKNSVVAEIPTKGLPGGILQITLFTSDWKPISERITFIKNKNYTFQPLIHVTQKGTGKREKNIIDISIEDSISTNMSISITDAELPQQNNGIISQMLLTGNMKGKIHNPDYYFSSMEDSVNAHLDLVMLTNGWRKYRWEDILSGISTVTPLGIDSNYFSIKGKIVNQYIETINYSTESLLLIIKGKDSSKQVLFVPFNVDGSFEIKDFVIFDTVELQYKLNNSKNHYEESAIQFNNGLYMGQPNKINSKFYLSNKSVTEKNSLDKLGAYQIERERFKKLFASTTLEEVIVRAPKLSKTDILDKKFTSGLFRGGDSYKFDVENDPYASSWDLAQFLERRVPKFKLNLNQQNDEPQWRNGSSGIFIDEIPINDITILNGYPMANISYIKYIKPNFSGNIFGFGGAIAIYTKKGGIGNWKSSETSPLTKAQLIGYTSYKEFYSPKYDSKLTEEIADFRTTLFWEPYLISTKNNPSFHIEFYNNDNSKKFRVILEGINSEGKITRIEKIIQ